MKYIFDRYWGVIEQANTQAIIGPAYSGQRSYFNQPEYQNQIGVGPIPAGTYTITEHIADDPHTGLNTFVLTPAPDNKMFGRSGFRIHGDNSEQRHTASDGCIITHPLTREKFEVGDVFVVV